MTADAKRSDPFTRMLHAATFAGAAFLLLCSTIAFFPELSWMDLPGHFALQYFVAALIGLGWSIYPLGTGVATKAVLVTVLALNFWLVMPYLPLPGAAPEAAAGTPLKILQANTMYINEDADRFRQLIADENPDLIVGVETNAVFAKMLAGLKTQYPYQDAQPRDHTADGLSVASKLPLNGLRVIVFTRAGMPSYTFDISRDNKDIHFIVLHTMNPLYGVEERDAGFRGAAQNIAAYRPRNMVMLGDFNATPWCPALRGLMRGNPELRNPREGRGFFLSWPVALPWPARIPIDQTLVSDTIAVQDYRLGPDIGSDHFPVISVLALKDIK